MTQISGVLPVRGGVVALPTLLAIVAASLVFAEAGEALLPAMSGFAAVLVRLATALVIAGPLAILVSRRSAPEAVANCPTDVPSTQSLLPVAAKEQDAQRVAFRCARCIADKLSFFSTFSGVVRESTESIIADTESNAVTLMDQLRIVETGMEGLLDFINATDSNDRVVQIIEHTEAQLSRSRSLIDEFSDKRLRDAASVQGAMDDIGNVVGGLSQMVLVVRGIAKQTRMLSLNATIEAVRAGESGKGFAVVASEVKELSLQSDKAAVEIGEGIGKLEKAVQDSLQTIVGDRIAKEESGFSVISEAVADLTDNLQRLISHQRDTLTKVQQENERLAEPIMQMIGAIQFQDVVKRRLRDLVQAFDQMNNTVDESVSQVSGDPDLSAEAMDAIVLDNLNRVAHACTQDLKARQSTDGNEPQAQGSAIELF